MMVECYGVHAGVYKARDGGLCWGRWWSASGSRGLWWKVAGVEGSGVEMFGEKNGLQLVSKTSLLCLTKRIVCHGHLVFFGDTNHEVPVNETSYVQTDDELTKKELKQIEADDQAIQTILLSLPENIYAAVDSCETA
uniref:Uncharacterized protein n=1 Tax=Tanacetum cinerariifolium TaxID=118510 RepID=A0A699IJS9_TANCI|nr:hypothetical protein [Tanacetum cinerariifolium]